MGGVPRDVDETLDPRRSRRRARLACHARRLVHLRGGTPAPREQRRGHRPPRHDDEAFGLVARRTTHQPPRRSRRSRVLPCVGVNRPLRIAPCASDGLAPALRGRRRVAHARANVFQASNDDVWRGEIAAPRTFWSRPDL